eukprot:8029852-Alexandrium_andersonii.AAC.1
MQARSPPRLATGKLQWSFGFVHRPNEGERARLASEHAAERRMPVDEQGDLTPAMINASPRKKINNVG